MMMVDFRDWGVNNTASTDFTVMNDEVRKIIEDYNFGSIILFANNIKETEQSYNLVYAMQEAATKDGGIALIICADQEGGSVYRLGSGTALPATMSDDILTGLLKGDMGFEGIIVTDAMNMAGISDKWDQVQSCVIAIQAGVDLICMPTQLYCKDDFAKLDAIIDGIIAAVEDGTIPMERINDAVTRILTVKENRSILDYNAEEHTLEKAKAVVGSDENRAKERELAAAAVTVIKNDGTLPLQLTENSKVLMLVPYNNERSQMLMAWNRAKEACLIPEGAEVDYITFSKTSTIDSLKEKMDWADTLIINSEISATSRAQAVTFLWRYLDKPGRSQDIVFSDVEDNRYYTDAVLWAADAGVTVGIGNGLFGVDTICSRGHMVTCLYRVLA